MRITCTGKEQPRTYVSQKPYAVEGLPRVSRIAVVKDILIIGGVVICDAIYIRCSITVRGEW